MRDAVALVKSPTIGTAFAVRSEAGHTIFVTAAHVVGCKNDDSGCADHADLYLGGDDVTLHRARVLAHGAVSRDDLALLDLPEGPLPVSRLSATALPSGSSIAVLGYPDYTVARTSSSAEAEVDLTLDLAAVGSTNTSQIFEFTGRSYHGDSGAPIFGSQSGEVVGVVHGQDNANLKYIGVGTSMLRSFLQRNESTIASTLTAGSPHEVAAAAFMLPTRRTACEDNFEGPQRAACFKHFADAGDAVAKYELAWLFLTGQSEENRFQSLVRHPPLNVAEGLRVLREAADLRQLDAEALLGRVYLHGNFGVDKDRSLARTWLARALDDAKALVAHGDSHGTYVLTELYFNGDMIESGVLITEPDQVENHKLLVTCAEQHDRRCMMELAWDLYFEGDRAAADRWFLLGAQDGDKEAMLFLAQAYRDGSGVTRDRDLAVRWYKAALPMPDAKFQLDLLGLGANQQ